MSTSDPEHDQIRTFIWGSCVSRDTFKFLPADFVLQRYVARQSLISAGTAVSGVREQLTPLASSFQQRMVDGDLRGDLFAALEAAAPSTDLVLIDLVDERSGVVRFPTGCVTKLHEFWGAGGREASRGAETIAFGTDEHFALWSKGAVRLAEELRRHGLLERTVVLRANWAAAYKDGAPLDVPDWMMQPAVADAAYGRYFAALEELGLRIVTLPAELARSTRDHEWGASPFHYQRAAYERFCSEIQAAARTDFSESPAITLEQRDTAQWGRFAEVASTEDIPSADLSTGLLTVWQDGLPFDLLIDDVGSATTLVTFHAARPATGPTPPLFTGRSISQGLGLNRIFVSDPGLFLGSGLNLAWYLGSAQVDATAALARIIELLQERMGARHLVFFGMSGGGFAALNVSHEFPGSLAVPTNPQTRILDYTQGAWEPLAREALGATSEEEARALLEAHPRADLRRLYAEGFDNTVIYVQNSADGHTSVQMIPWFDAIGWKGDASIRFGRWGKGHVPPPGPELRQMLAELAPADGDWAQVAERWDALTRPDRATVRRLTGR